MTLPFRRRHHDDEAWHDRARALFSAEFLGPLSDADQAWLDRHLEQCGECRADRAAYASDRALLQGLKDRSPAPPRDLWARTAAAIDRQNATSRSRRGPLRLPLPAVARRGLPYGPLAGALVALVVLVVALMPQGVQNVPGTSTGSSQVALVTPAPQETPMVVPAGRVAWITSGDGNYSIVIANVGEVCATPDQGCSALTGSSPAPLDLGAQPQAVVLSPSSNQVAVVSAPGQSAGSILIVTVPTPKPSGSVPPIATATPPSAPPFSVLPTQSAAGSPGASPTTVPVANGHAIIHGVTVVGETGYSADGQWFAFSARPQVGVGGPDLYVWHVGDDQATRLSANGATYFSGWFQNQIVASGIRVPVTNDLNAGTSPGTTSEPTAVPPTAPGGSGEPLTSPTSAPPSEAHPFSFLLDPATRAETGFARPDAWLPAIDPTGRFVTYWSGTVAPVGPVTTPNWLASPGLVAAWRPATGRLVLDGWSAPLASTSPSGAPSNQPSSPDPSEPAIAAGPAGTPIVLAEGPLGDFEAAFDPTGRRLAVWTADPDDPSIGPLWLVVLDPIAGGPVATEQPLQAPGTVALRGFSIDEGRLAWVTPPGQDGQPSTVRVLGWRGDEFGQVETVPGGNPQIVR